MEASMKQSKVVILVTLGVLALSACGTQIKPSDTVGDPVIDGNNNGGGTGGENGGGGGTGGSLIPEGPSGNPRGNVDFKLSKDDKKLVRGIIEGLSQGNGPANVIGGLASLGKAFSRELNVGTQSCDAGGTFTSNSTGGDSDDDGIPVSAKVSFANCAYNVTTGDKTAKFVLNGTLDVADNNPNENDNSFLFATTLRVTGSGSLEIAGTHLDINGSADLKFGLDIKNKSDRYEIALGAELTADGKTLAARFDAKITPEDSNNYGKGGAIALTGKIGLGSDTVLGLSTEGLTYTDTCATGLNHGSLTVTDGTHNLVLTQNGCGIIDGKVDGEYVDL
jgi:hypothetical protein